MRIVRRSPSVRSTVMGSSLYSVGARPPVLKGELVRVSNWAHGTVAGWRRGLNWSNS